MTISYHSSLMQTQPFLFYQLVDVYHTVAAFGLSNIVTNFVTLYLNFLIAMYMYILCIRPLGHCHNNFNFNFNTQGRPPTEQPVGFTANYEEEVTQELTEAKNQRSCEAERPANAFSLSC